MFLLLILFLLFFFFFFFFFNDTATTEIYTLSLHDALPIATGMAIGSTRISAMPATMNGMVQPTVHRVHSLPQRRSRSRSIGTRHGTVASSGSAALPKRLAAGDRLAQDHQVRIRR